MNKKLFIDSYIEKISKRFKLTNDLAFEIFVNSIILNKDFDDIFENISTIEKGKKGQWTGSNDGGFDGIYIDEDELSLVVIQIKNQTNIGDNEISKFINDFENIFIYDNRANIKLNKTVVSKKDEYISIIKSGYIIEPKLYFVFNGEIDHKNQERIKNFSNSCEYLEILDSNLLYEKIESIVFQNKTRKNIEFSFKAQKSNISFKNDPQGLISYSLANVKAVNFRLEALELCKLLDKEKSINKNIDTLFSKNIRGYLGQNKTNNKIKQTLLGEDAEYFPFLNNGITVIAQIVNIPKQMNAGIYNIATTNPVIVNGLQTTRVMYDVYQKDSSMLEDVYIIVRLYETNDSELLEKITDATNTQSPISFRDRLSNKKFNQYAKELFESRDIGYLTKRGDTFSNTFSKNLKASVENELVLKFWYATFFERPSFAKSYKSKVMEFCYDASTDENHILYKLFSGDKNSPLYLQLLMSYKIYEFVVIKRKEYQGGDDFIYSADELFSYAIYKELVQRSFVNIEQHLEGVYQEQFVQIQKIVKNEKEYKENNSTTYSHNDYFKSEKSFFDINRINKWVEANQEKISYLFKDNIEH